LLKDKLISSLNNTYVLDGTTVIHDFLSLDTGVRPSV
jgi:hypothetical protein